MPFTVVLSDKTRKGPSVSRTSGALNKGRQNQKDPETRSAPQKQCGGRQEALSVDVTGERQQDRGKNRGNSVRQREAP